MSTAIVEKSSGVNEKARKKRLAEAHVLAARIFRHYAEAEQFMPDEARVQSYSPRDLPEFQRALILRTAADAALRHHPEFIEGPAITSRRQLSPLQLGIICADLRARMRELGIEEPEARRDRVSSAEIRVSTSQWRQLTLLIDRVETELGWSRQHLRNWMKSSLHIYSARPKTSAEALRIIRGLEGVLRHSKKEATS